MKVKNSHGIVCEARVERLLNGKWRIDYRGSGLVELRDVKPEAVR